MRRFRHWMLKRRIKKARALLRKIDAGMRMMGMPRWKSKQMWRDFIKSADVRQEIFDMIEVK